ncbi:hypothetical protein FGO68_gene10991 [Halteria grandinella]|uniref:Uncharacterized protein n=1 Tax=Halteria grandinella TaxID=5974 RepID=A0A8J8NCE0_HALGN|nr:hypothetical protein FGO68_gene10991 [Halteria grandinella]
MKEPEERFTAQMMLDHAFLSNAEKEYEQYQMNLTCGTLSNLITSIRTQSMGRQTENEAVGAKKKQRNQQSEDNRGFSADRLKDIIKEHNRKKSNQRLEKNVTLKQGLQELGQKVIAYADAMSSLENKRIPADPIKGIQKKNKINLEAYHAYYNNTEQCQTSSYNPYTQAQPPPLGFEAFPHNTRPQSRTAHTQPSTNIVNNIVHINHGGANINITTLPNTQNNFIFNNTAPVNLNFYRSASNGVIPMAEKSPYTEENNE